MRGVPYGVPGIKLATSKASTPTAELREISRVRILTYLRGRDNAV